MTNDDLKKKCETVVDDLENCLNYSDRQVLDTLKDKLPRMHRTLQQNFWRTIHALAVEYGASENFDLRNAESVKYCKKVAELEEVYFPIV